MRTPMYDIKDFEYNKRNKTFRRADYPIYTIAPYIVPYGNADTIVYKADSYIDGVGSKQFYILNPDTGNSRRFRLSWENEDYKYFYSEDGYTCLIIKGD